MKTDYIILGSVLFLSLVSVGTVLYLAYISHKNEKNFNKFRFYLKIGAKTSEGIVTKIDRKTITIEKKVDISQVYPPKNYDMTYIYKDDSK